MKDPVVLITDALTGIGRDSTRLRERRVDASLLRAGATPGHGHAPRSLGSLT